MKRLCVILLALALSAPAFCCTTAIVSAGASYSGRPLLWKQRDASDKYNIIARVEGGTYAYTGLFPTRDTLRTTCYAGINEAGFAIINNLSYNLRPDSLGFDTKAGPLMARALAECVTVEDFERLLTGVPVPRLLSTNFGVADSAGGAAYFEAGDSTYVRFDVPQDDILFRTNYSLSGDPSRGRGYARFQTMDFLTEPPGLFGPEFFFKAGRSFIKDGRDELRGKWSGEMLEHDFIPRSTTISSIVIEVPVREGERGLMWCATGYTPCCYAIPVWDGYPIPEALQGGANLAAVKLFDRIHSKEDGKMLKIGPLRRIMRIVAHYERREARIASRLARRGPDASSIEKYHQGADRRFRNFKKRMKL